MEVYVAETFNRAYSKMAFCIAPIKAGKPDGASILLDVREG